MNKIFISVLIFLGFISFAYADSNGIWIDASDIRGGTFGSDESPISFNFSVPVFFNAGAFFGGVDSSSLYVKKGELDSITSVMITDSAILSEDIFDGTITSADIRDNTITSADLAPGSVGSSELELSYRNGLAYDGRFVLENQVNSITSAMVSPDSLTAADLAPGSVGSSELQDNLEGGSLTFDNLIVDVITPKTGNTVVIQLS